MAESDLHRAFLLSFLAATASVVLLATLIGIRIGFGVTKPLYALIKGTREMARDNLEYRIPMGREDEIGLLIESFNKMAEDLKENRRKRLEAEQIAAWREIARRLAHEIKNPLTPIQLTVQQLKDKYSGEDPAYQKLVTDCTEIVTEEVENLRALVQEFTDFARMPALLLAPVDLNSIVRGVVRLYPDVRIHNSLSPELPTMTLDVEQIRRVLINLIENGIDASGDKAQITIVTRVAEGQICLCVFDNGPGVPEEERQRIFQPYISSKDSGMGLGLAVVRGIIEDHRGHISVTDAPDGGAQFDICLPMPDSTVGPQNLETTEP
jgi:two-component system nitrogen regulation sensor histidine kinase NtrY